MRIDHWMHIIFLILTGVKYSTAYRLDGVDNIGEDCWKPCGEKAGACDWCGSEGACCRKGYAADGCEPGTGPPSFYSCTQRKIQASAADYCSHHCNDYCDDRAGQNGLDAGPGTLVWKTNGDKLLWYGSDYWENDALLNVDSPPEAIGNAKYASYMSQAFSTISMCIHEPKKNCISYTFNKQWNSAYELFTSGTQYQSDLSQTSFLSNFGVPEGWYADCPMNSPGFNVKCRQNNWTRFGYCNNCAGQPCDSTDADGAIGIGLKSQVPSLLHGETSYIAGGGWSPEFAAGPNTCTEIRKDWPITAIWLYVK